MAKGVGTVPAPNYLVVAAAGDDARGIEVVGIDIVDAGNDGIGRDGLHGVGGHAAGGAGAEREVDDSGGFDSLQAEVSPGIAVGCLVDGLDGGAVGAGAGDGGMGAVVGALEAADRGVGGGAVAAGVVAEAVHSVGAELVGGQPPELVVSEILVDIGRGECAGAAAGMVEDGSAIGRVGGDVYEIKKLQLIN